METRKLISFGINSYVVSLPKSWLDKNSLTKGDSVSIYESENELTITTQGYSAISEKEIEIVIDKKSKDVITTEIVTAYLRGYDSLKIKGVEIDKRITFLRTLISTLSGMEIMMHTNREVVIKNLLNEKNVSVKEILVRTNNMILSMMQDACNSKEMSESIVQRDKDVNRMCYLAFRVLRKIMEDKEFARAASMKGTDVTIAWLMLLRMEEIADQTKRISTYLAHMEEDRRLEKTLLELFEELQLNYKTVIENYSKRDTGKLLEIVGSAKRDIQTKCFSIIETKKDIFVLRTVEEYRNMAISIQHIAESLLAIP